MLGYTTGSMSLVHYLPYNPCFEIKNLGQNNKIRLNGPWTESLIFQVYILTGMATATGPAKLQINASDMSIQQLSKGSCKYMC